MKKNIRFSIRAKFSIMSMVTIALAAITLGIFLLMTFRNSAYNSALDTLKSVSSNAASSLSGEISSSDTSMNLLVNQIGNNADFANNIENVSISEEAKDKITVALSGEDGFGDGSTIIGAMDYLVVSDDNIISATMYSPFVTTPILSRLLPTSQSKIECTEDRYNLLLEHPGQSYWFFNENNELYVWRALVNYGVTDIFDMKVVGYIEYEFDRTGFMFPIQSSQYENQGMLLYDEYNNLIFSLSSGLEKVDNLIFKNVSNLKEDINRTNSYSYYKCDIKTTKWSEIDSKKWIYISYINHRSIEKTTNQGGLLTVVVVLISVIVSAVIAFIISNREIKRIRGLSKAAGEISGGKYDVRIKLKANDEITDLGSSFNTMSEKIQDVLEELILQQDSISENFATILSNKSGESGNHVKRVSEYSAILASELGFSDNDVHDIRIASMLHDVGKIMVDEAILHKPGRFTDEEYKIMQQHVVYGGQLLNGVPGNIMRLGAIIAEHHHERYDGNGYVKGLKGEEIPKEAQITSVADVFDALVSKRCYKGAWTIEEAYNEIVSQSGKQFAPDVVEAFKKRFDDFKHISTIYKEEE